MDWFPETWPGKILPSGRGRIQGTGEAEGLSGIFIVTQYVGDRDVVLTHATQPSQPYGDLLDTFFLNNCFLKAAVRLCVH